MIQMLLNGLWQDAFIVAVAAGVTVFVPQRHAATRYAVWFAALIALALLPFSGQFSLAEPASAIPSSVIRTTTVASNMTERAASVDGLWSAAFWVAGVIIGMVRLALNYLQIARIMRTSVRAPHIGEDVFTSSSVAIPIAAGFRHPVVIVPDDVAATLDRTDLDCIVAHERAHIRRNDIVGNLLQRLLESLFFFNPWVYVIGRQLVKEREAACDDWAVRSASDYDRYASCLVSLAQRNPRAVTPLLSPSAIGSGRMLVGRIARLLNGKATQLKTNYVVLAGAIGLFALLAFAFQAPSSLASTGNAVAANNSNLLDPKCWGDATVLNPVAPVIPKAVAKAHPHSQASVLVTIAANGLASAVKVVDSSGNSIIDKAASDAAAHSTYKPEMRHCKAVADGKYLFHIEVGPY